MNAAKCFLARIKAFAKGALIAIILITKQWQIIWCTRDTQRSRIWTIALAILVLIKHITVKVVFLERSLAYGEWLLFIGAMLTAAHTLLYSLIIIITMSIPIDTILTVSERIDHVNHFIFLKEDYWRDQGSQSNQQCTIVIIG
jgi:hypothetical protein